MEKLINPEPGADFEANGTKYYVSNSLSTERYEIMEQLRAQFAFGSEFIDFFNSYKVIIELCNENKLGQIAITAYNAMNSISNIEQNLVYCFELCTLWVNYEGEDVRFWNKDLAEKKRNDWKLGGIDSMYFFQLAASLVPGYMRALKELHLISSSQK